MRVLVSPILICLLVAGLSPDAASGQCFNECGVGDVDEGELCLSDDDQDLFNPGCNEVPRAFSPVSCNIAICGTASTYFTDATNFRDTDWYLIQPLDLAAADVDGDGIVQLRATLTSDFPGQVSFVDLNDPICTDWVQIGIRGFSDPFCAGGRSAEVAINLSLHPNGLAMPVTLGNPDGTGIFVGFPCGTDNDYVVQIDCFDVPGLTIATGSDPLEDAYLEISPDEFGSWVTPSFGGRGDGFNPPGPIGFGRMAFTSGSFLFVPSEGQRELLSVYPNWQGQLGFFLDKTLLSQIISPLLASDSTGDGVDDTLVSTFRVFGGTTDLQVDLNQRVGEVSTDGAELVQTYTITNVGPVPVDGVLVRVFDGDLDFVGDFGNDTVGTNTNIDPGDRRVLMRESATPETLIEISSREGDGYFAGKRGVLPPGAVFAFDNGTDTEVWDSFGVPVGWRNFTAGVGQNTDGFSGIAPPGCTPPCDAFIGLETPFSLLPAEVIVITIRSAFGRSAFADPQEFLAVGAAFRKGEGDLDGDGTVDVMTIIAGGAGPMPGQVQVFLNQGTDPTGGWLGFVANNPENVGNSPSGVALGQFNSINDMDLDAAVTNAADNTVSILLNNGAGTGMFLPQTTVPVGNAPSAVATGDFNEDGNADLIIANENDNTVILLLGDGLGGFMTPPGPMGTSFVGFQPRMLLTDDIDNDKCDDVVGINGMVSLDPGPVNGTVFVLHGIGGGLFDPVVEVEIGQNPTDISIGDIDEDGFRDVVATNADDATVSVLRNTVGSLGVPTDVSVGATPMAIVATDVDGDLDPDLAVVAFDPDLGQAVQLLSNDTDEGEIFVFDVPTAFGVDAAPNFIGTADFNQDGLNDLITANTDDGVTSGSVTVLINQFCIADFNQNGAVDISDLLVLLAAWGISATGPPDFDNDGIVGIFDLLFLLSLWGLCPGNGA